MHELGPMTRGEVLETLKACGAILEGRFEVPAYPENALPPELAAVPAVSRAVAG